jgi:cation/acetate symporter
LPARGISAPQNGLAIAGDYMSASSFLGFDGLIFFFGLDGFIGLVAALVAFVPVLLFLAARLRNAGKFTVADVLLCALFWKRFNAAGAVTGVLGGLVASLVLIALSPAVWPGPDGEGRRCRSPTRRCSRSRSASCAAGWARC